jgi:hypothetical protein
MKRRHLHVMWSTRWFNFMADRLGFTLAYGRLVVDPHLDDLTYHPHLIGIRKGLGGWRFINR